MESVNSLVATMIKDLHDATYLYVIDLLMVDIFEDIFVVVFDYL